MAADLPVGDNLHDHMFVPMTYCMTSARNRGTTPYFTSPPGVVTINLTPPNTPTSAPSKILYRAHF